MPFGCIRQDRPDALGHRAKVDFSDRQHAITDDPDVELASPDVLLDQDLVELLGHRGDTGFETLAVGYDRLAIESRARVLRGRLDDGRQREVVVDLPLRYGPAGHRQSGPLEQRVRDRFATADGRRPGSAPR